MALSDIILLELAQKSRFRNGAIEPDRRKLVGQDVYVRQVDRKIRRMSCKVVAEKCCAGERRLVGSVNSDPGHLARPRVSGRLFGYNQGHFPNTILWECE